MQFIESLCKEFPKKYKKYLYIKKKTGMKIKIKSVLKNLKLIINCKISPVLFSLLNLEIIGKLDAEIELTSIRALDEIRYAKL